MNISVCMATYNGERYVAEQITSILDELKSDDEVIVVDDCSKDGTVKILQDLNDLRIKIYLNDRNKGINVSFERAIYLANNDFIFLSDQDDIWIKGRVSLMVKRLLDTESLLVSSNFEFMDINGRKIGHPVDGVKSSNSRKHLNNILDIFIGKTNYYGCAMAFRKDMVELILPIPSFVESHDLWIALGANVIGSNTHLDEKSLIKRIHNNNATITNRNLFLKIWSRFIFGISIVVLLLRAKNYTRKK
jgi:glycosyltransferase involved in cell wall biosynthesis